MSLYEIVFYSLASIGCVLLSGWALAREARRDASPPWGYYLLAFSQFVFALVVLLRLYGSWAELAEAWRFLAALACGLFSTSAAMLVAQATRLRRRGPTLLER